MASLWISPVPVPPAAAVVPLDARSAPSGRLAPKRRAASPVAVSARRLPWLYYRRRAGAVAVVAAAFLAAWQLVSVVGASLVDSPGTQLGRAPRVPVVVHDAVPGETLWSIAVELGPSGDPRRALDELVRLNGGSTIYIGEPVRVPASWYGRVGS